MSQSRLLYFISSLNLLFSLISLHLWGPLPLSALKNCYSCCYYRLLHLLFLLYLLFLYVLSKCFVIFVVLEPYLMRRNISQSIIFTIQRFSLNFCLVTSTGRAQEGKKNDVRPSSFFAMKKHVHNGGMP